MLNRINKLLEDFRRNVYWVLADQSQWKVKIEGQSKALSYHETKADAIDKARKLAHANKPSQVKVQKKDRNIKTEWTYGGDPCPPRG